MEDKETKGKTKANPNPNVEELPTTENAASKNAVVENVVNNTANKLEVYVSSDYDEKLK